LRKVLAMIDKVAKSDSTVLIYGESGVGKELVALSIHKNSLRAKEPFVIIDCTTLRENLLESELFGHERGAYTDAVSLKHGLFEVADSGTVFMDEIGEISPPIQAKLLRVMETGTFRRVGGNKTITVDVRLIAATNSNLRQLVSEGKFRADLFYRLEVFSIHVPPLRERKEDIPLLVQHFVQNADAILQGSGEVKRQSPLIPLITTPLPPFGKGEGGKGVVGVRGLSKGIPKRISKEAMQILVNYDWPGNVRELENLIKRAIILAEGDVITPNELPANLRATYDDFYLDDSDNLLPLKEIEKQYISKVLRKVKGHRKKAAEALGISERNLYRKLKEDKIADDKMSDT